MKTELEEIKKELESTLEGFKDAYENYGYDLANERYDVETALKKVNLLLLHNVSQQSELLNFLKWYDEDLEYNSKQTHEQLILSYTQKFNCG